MQTGGQVGCNFAFVLALAVVGGIYVRSLPDSDGSVVKWVCRLYSDCAGIGFMLVGEGHEHLQIEYIQLDPGDKSGEGQVGGEQAQIGGANG